MSVKLANIKYFSGILKCNFAGRCRKLVIELVIQKEHIVATLKMSVHVL